GEYLLAARAESALGCSARGNRWRRGSEPDVDPALSGAVGLGVEGSAEVNEQSPMLPARGALLGPGSPVVASAAPRVKWGKFPAPRADPCSCGKNSRCR